MKDEMIMQGEQAYIRMAEIVERCDATAFLVLQRMNPGVM